MLGLEYGCIFIKYRLSQIDQIIKKYCFNNFIDIRVDKYLL